MKAELIGDTTYKITLDRDEAAQVPADGSPRVMHRFICEVIDRLSEEQGISLPDGRLLVEAFLRSDGSCVFFVSALDRAEKQHRQRLFACELSGADMLYALCEALAAYGISGEVYCGAAADRYRVIFRSPCADAERICSEFGEYCEISPLFAAQTEEYLTQIATGDMAAILSDIFG